MISFILGLYIGVALSVMVALEVLMATSGVGFWWYLLALLASVFWAPVAIVGLLVIVFIYFAIPSEDSDSKKNREFLPKE